MAKIKFEDGTVVNFDGTPTPADIEEVARSLGKSTQPEQPSGPTGIGGFALGALKGLGHTVKGGTSLVAKGLDKIGGVVDKAMGVKKPVGPSAVESVNWALPDKALKANNPTQKAGFITEQIGEFLVPGGASTKVGKAFEGAELLAKAPAAIRTLARVGGTALSEGLIGAGQTQVQGGDAKTAGLVSAAIPVAGEVLPLVRKLFPASRLGDKVEKAVGEITQSKAPEDFPIFKRAIDLVKTKGVKTFQDLQTKFDDLVPKLANKVDVELMADPNLYKLKDLVVETASNMGKKVKTDYVGTALKDLSELYSKIGDKTMKANIDEVLREAQSKGITRLDVNDLSRLYNKEFGDKAFSKLGDPLTSVNAQAYEMTRKGLKEVARKGLGGSEAKALDSQLSDIFDTQKLIQKNIEAVQGLKNRVTERGLLKKLGRRGAQLLDLATGKTLSGFLGGLMPRNVGYETMNALDIEKALQKNLKTVQRALKAKDDNTLIRILKSATPPAVKAVIKGATSLGTRE